MGQNVFKTQALIVTKGPFQGRICENDDEDFVFMDELSDTELQWFEACGVTWRELEVDPLDGFPTESKRGVDCEIVTFGHYLGCRGYYFIPREFLRPASIRDLVSRAQEISNSLMRFAVIKEDFEDYKGAFDALTEYSYIVDQIWKREKIANFSAKQARKLFLCHASDDKYFVRQVRIDLAAAGHSVWMDEFEIKVGDSIVEKISTATETAEGLILFVSNASNNSPWVKKEWQSVLMRYLNGGTPKIYPVRIEECQVPAIIADVRYADFSESYNDGLENLLEAIGQSDR